METKIKVSVVGASGFTGIELLKLLVYHPNVAINTVTSRDLAGKQVEKIFPIFSDLLSHQFVSPEEEVLVDSDLVFFATPKGVAMNYAGKLLERGVRIIDLGADFRIKDADVWKKWYGMEHKHKNILKNAVYGLPEVNREKIKTANLIANPGCYATAVQLALLPLLVSSEKLINHSTIVADAKSGISGAGRASETESFIENATENFKAYGVSGHRHQPEMEENLTSISAHGDVRMTFIPHLVPMNRGICATIYVDCVKDFDSYDLFKSFYKGETHVEVMTKEKWPETKSVKGTNTCRISVYKSNDSNKLVVLSVLDNLIKGAAGQAIQNMNIMMNWAEDLGLN
jgi:N-acetyl-gamma-glutamyl-phosphate reductase|tara:strand:+ start:5309 stop:6337 length:1029 start_codon:yes stop_codon:yes gene_type:complete